MRSQGCLIFSERLRAGAWPGSDGRRRELAHSLGLARLWMPL